MYQGGRSRKGETRVGLSRSPGNGSREFSPDVYTRDPPKKVGFNPLHDDITHGRRRPPSPPTNRTYTAPQGVRPPTGSGSRPYVPAVQGGAPNTRTLAAEMPNLDGLRQHTFGSPSLPLGVLTADPEKVLALARATI